MTLRLLLNSIKPKDYARNAREEEVWCVCLCVCVCVLFSTPLSIYSREPPAAAPQTDAVSNREAPHALVEAAGLTGLAGRPGRSVGLLGLPTAPNFLEWVSWSPLVIKLRHGLPQLGLH